VFRRAQSTTNEPMACYIYGVRRAALVLFSRLFYRGSDCVDRHTSHDEHTICTHRSVHKLVQSFLNGAPESCAQQRFRTVNGRLHRPVRVHHGHQSASGHGQVSELSEIRAGRGHRARTIRHRHASAVGFQQSHTAIRVRRETSVRKDVGSIFNRQQQVLRHTRRSGE